MSIERKFVQAEMNAQLYCAFKPALTLVAHIHIHLKVTGTFERMFVNVVQNNPVGSH